MNNIKNIYEFKEEDLEPTDSFEVKETLNPDVWDDFKIKPDIRERLLEISNEFINNLYGDFDISDIFLIGSLASYNWSQYSDFDVHIQLEYSDINPDTGLVENYLDLLGKRWNRDYSITLYDYEVELYVEDMGQDRSHINGLYSILKDKWIKRPSDDIEDVDTHLVEKKAINLMEQVDEIESRLDSADYDEIKDDVDRIWDKIKKARRDGINSPDGEYSIGNLVFKYLRRNDYIGKIIDIKSQLVEKKYSI